MLSATDNKDTKSQYLETICRQVDHLVRDKSKEHLFGEKSIWRTLEEGPRTQELFIKCLVYKLISLSYGLAENALQESVRLIENATKNPPPVLQQKPRAGTDHQLKNSISDPHDPRSRSGNGNTSSELIKRRKSTESKANMNVRKSMAVSNFVSTRSGNTKVKKAQTFSEKLINIQQETEEAERKALENKMTRDILYTLAFTTTVFDPTKWDYNSLREVFLMWNRAREWSGSVSKFEVSTLKVLSICPKYNSDKEKWVWRFEQLLDSMGQNSITPDGFFDDFAVANGLKYWPLRENVEKKMPLSLSIGLIVDSAEKILNSGETKKLLPILHLFRESMVMAHHVPFQVLQRAYSTFLGFYTWPAVYASAVKDTLDVIQTEMKSPGYFYRVLYIQEHDMHNLFEEANFDTTRNVSNMYVDENIECAETLVRICNNMWNCGRQTTAADACSVREETFHLLFHIFTSVYGTDECDLDSLSAILKKCPHATLSSFCVEALHIMDESAEMDSHQLAQPHIRQQLEKLTQKIVEVSEDAEMKMRQKNRRFTLIVQPQSSEIYSSPTKDATEQTMKRRSTQTIEQIVSEIGRTNCSGDSIMDFEMSTQEFDFEDFKDEMFGLLRNTAKIYVKEKRKSIVRRRSTLKNVGRDSGVVDDMIVKNRSLNRDTEATMLLDPMDTRGHLSSDLHSRSSRRSSLHSDADDNETKKYWLTFLNKGFATDDSDHKVLDDLLKSMSLDCPRPLSNRSSMDGGRSPRDHDPVPVVNPDHQINFDDISNTSDVNTFVERDRTCSQGSHSSSTKEERGLPKSKRRQFKDYKNRFKTLGKKGLTRMLSSARRKPMIGLNSGLEGDTLDDQDFVPDEGNVESDSLSVHDSPTRDFTKNDDSGLKTWAKFTKNRKNTGHVRDIFVTSTPTSTRSSFSTSPSLKVIDDQDRNSARSRMDSGIVTERNDDVTFRRSRSTPPQMMRGGNHPDGCLTGISKWGYSRKNPIGSKLTKQIHRKQILKLVVAGNDVTLGQLARSYYYLRQEQAARSPMLSYVDLRIYYIPIGNYLHADETEDKGDLFDLRYANTIGVMDSWYYNIFGMGVNSFLRLYRNMEEDPRYADEEPNKPRVIENMVTSAIVTHSRFAINTFNIPLFKVLIHTSTDDVITEVMAISLNIGSYAYQKAVKEGKFGKCGKLVDLSENATPPKALTCIDYTKFGISGNVTNTERLDSAFYDCIDIEPTILNSSPNTSCFSRTMDDLSLFTEKLGKKAKGRRFRRSNDSNTPDSRRLTVNQVKVQVTDPPQGTFTLCLDNKILHTNVKSVEVCRCMTPDHEKGGGGGGSRRDRSSASQVDHTMNLPIKIYWPESY